MTTYTKSIERLMLRRFIDINYVDFTAYKSS